jgi:alcohol dehydrogenase YqhD (iron-dependent ADH family)
MNHFTFRNPTQIFFGEGQLKLLPEQAKRLGQKVLLVYGGGSIKKFGLYDQVVQLLRSVDAVIYELAGVEPNPRLTTVNKGIDICKKENIDWILAVGGGSVIDASKAIAAGAKYDGDVWDFFSRKAVIQDALPLGTVLTLAATGSEMNSGAVVTHWEANEKRGAGSPYTFPVFSILDPQNTYTVPKDQTVYGAVDMLSHVFEQYFSHTPNTPLQDRLCESVMLTIIENTPKVLENPEDYDARANIMYCGTMALNGMISMGMLGDWASHPIEHVVSAHYDIPHAGGLAIIFPNWMRHVLSEGTDKFVQMAVRVWGVDPTGKTDLEVAHEGIDRVREFLNSIGAPSRLADYNITDEKLDLMAKQAVAYGPLGQYKRLNEEDVAAILRASL